MFASTCRVKTLGPRDWPTLRDLVVRASGSGQCRDLTSAITEADRPADAWRERMAGMCGSGRLLLFVFGGDGRAQGFVSAYVDGDRDDRYVIVRHLLALPTPTEGAGATTAHVLLDRVESWGANELASEVLLEVEVGNGRPLGDFLAARGYAPTGVTRPAFDGSDAAGRIEADAIEWRRGLSAPRSRSQRGIFAVAS